MYYTFIRDSGINPQLHETMRFILVENENTKELNNKNDVCICVNKQNNKQGEIQKLKQKYKYIACNSKNMSDINFWITKKIDFIINPFDDKARYFDENMINVIRQNNIVPIFCLDEFKHYNKMQTAYFLKNAYLFANICIEKRLTVLIDSFGSANKKTNIRQELANYKPFGFTQEQGKMFNRMVFEYDEEKI